MTEKASLGLLGALCFVAGAAIGFLSRSYLASKKEKQDEAEQKEEKDISPSGDQGDVVAVKELDKKEFKDYQNEIKKHNYDMADSSEAEEVAENVAKDISKEVDEYEEKNKNLIKVLGDSPIDPDNPDFDYETVKDVYYFRVDDMFCDESGYPIDERILGPIRTADIFHDDDEMDVWVRNNPMKTDIHVVKILEDSYESFYPGRAPSEDDD